MSDSQLSNLLQGQQVTLTPQLSSNVSTLLSAASIVITVLSLVAIILYISSLVRRWKVQSAIFDIQKQVREINQRDQAKQAPQQAEKLQNSVPSIDPNEFAKTNH